MKSLCAVLVVVLVSLSTAAVAQTEAQKSFDKMKTCQVRGKAGNNRSADPEMEGKLVQFSLRVTSMGNALVHEMTVAGRPDHPITMFYVDSDRLTLTHYCDAGNRPRMMGKASPDGKTVEFEFLDLAGNISTDTCIMRCSPSSTRTTTPKTGPTWWATSRCARTSTCNARNATRSMTRELSGNQDGP